MQNNEYYIGELLRLQRQAASTQRMGDSASPDPRAEYKRTIGSAWTQPFELNDSVASSDSTSFADGADSAISFGDTLTIMAGLLKAKLARQAATKNATDDANDAVDPRTEYVQQLCNRGERHERNICTQQRRGRSGFAVDS